MSQRDNDGSRKKRPIAPLYKRLPRGPHHLAPNDVVRHQRLRMHGAMVEAVAINGYAGVSVKQVIGLAGVSRRVFYEQFANKQECFLATFDMIATHGVKRLNDAYRSTAGGLQERMTAAFGELTDEAATNTKGASLAIVEAPAAGADGLLHLRRATATCERMLSSSFTHAPDAERLPAPIVRGIVGGVHEATSLRLREGRAEELPALTDELVDWALLFQAPSIPRVSARLAERVRSLSASIAPAPLVPDARRRAYSTRAARGMGGVGISPGARLAAMNGYGRLPQTGDQLQECRKRLLQTVLDLTVLEDYHSLSVPQIFEAAGVPIEIFLELFASKEECFLAAFDELSDELLQIAADPALVSDDWPYAVRRVLGELMSILAAKPIYAHTIAAEAPGAGAEARARNFELAHGIATLLTEGAPEQAHNMLALEGVAGALWHTIGCQVSSGQIHLLPALSDYLAYLVLVPFLGPDTAAEIVLEDDPALTPGAAIAC